MRHLWAFALALLLALRVIGSAGYMPMVDQGRLTLMLCPDGEWTAPTTAMNGMAMDHQGPKPASRHQLCPYAAAAAMHATSGDLPAPVPLPSFTFVVVAGVAAATLVRRALYRRPPSTGPPIPA